MVKGAISKIKISLTGSSRPIELNMQRSTHVNSSVEKWLEGGGGGGKPTATRKDGILPQSLVQRFLAKFPVDDALCSESSGHATDATIRSWVKCKINLQAFSSPSGDLHF